MKLDKRKTFQIIIWGQENRLKKKNWDKQKEKLQAILFKMIDAKMMSKKSANKICCFCLVTQSCLTLWNRIDGSPCNPLSMGFPKVKYLSGLRFPSPGDLSDPGIEPGSPTLLVYSLVSKLPGKPSLQGPVLKKEGRSSCWEINNAKKTTTEHYVMMGP